ncbi:unnamed protein product [Ilex paraguariensis]|uniref:Uncharacterized protein n=1 Tax=Ilex paraguariensis TaxID=185542 RepID=A0ABC8TER0_9AQUA
MQCSTETLAKLFYNVSSSFLLLFLFFYLTSIFLAKLFHYLGGYQFFPRNQDVYEFGVFSDEEEEENNGYYHGEPTETDHLVADIIQGGESLSFLPTRSIETDQFIAREMIDRSKPMPQELDESFGTEDLSVYGSPIAESEHSDEEVVGEEIPTRDTDSAYNTDTNNNGPTLRMADDDTHEDIIYAVSEKREKRETENGKMETNFTRDDNFLIFQPPKLETKKLLVHEKEKEEIFGDSCTVGSTSKSSSEWRSSIRDTGTEDPFSSSSRRSCPKWESYTVFQKYDEEMLFLDRISAQKLHETETLAKLFYNVSSSFLLLFLFFYLTSIFLAKLFHYLGGYQFFPRNQDVYEFGVFSDEEEEENNGYYHGEPTETDHLVADIIQGGESLSFLPTRSIETDQFIAREMIDRSKPMPQELDESFGTEDLSVYGSPIAESEHSDEEVVGEEIPTRDTDSAYNTDTNNNGPTLRMADDDTHEDIIYAVSEKREKRETENGKMETNFTRDDNFLIFQPPKLETKKLLVHEKEKEEIFGDSCTVGSTSKSSSEWRSSIRDTGTEDPFSSSSRRSCPKWESYTVFQKYDEEMLFLDRISAQKLHETESLRSIQACPRSISERIVHKMATRNKRSSDFHQNPYLELEAAYVAQICLTWEALNWNYKYFQRLRASHHDSDPGCPAGIAQQFQQFHVLLQRYVENEPYRHGRRPEVYARIRSLAPKLLQVPEYRDSEDEKREEGLGSRISSNSFVQIMEEAIRTFMNFLKADRENHCQILAAFFRRNRRGSVDPIRFLQLKKVNKKKKLKIKDLRRPWKCFTKRRLKEEDEMEILLALIDIKVVSRVLRMTDLSEDQLQWCEGKMNKVKVSDGKLHRDSSPLFFPAH